MKKQTCTESALYLSGELLCEPINLSKQILTLKPAFSIANMCDFRMRVGIGFMAYDDKCKFYLFTYLFF